MDTSPFYIFLDFDGVLHKWGDKPFSENPNLLKLIYQLKIKMNKDIVVVFSTSHRLHKTIEQLVYDIDYFNNELGLSTRELVTKFDVTPNFAFKSRYQEIQSFIKTHSVSDFIVLDDLDILYDDLYILSPDEIEHFQSHFFLVYPLTEEKVNEIVFKMTNNS